MNNDRESRNRRLIDNTVLLTIGTIMTKCIQLVMIVFYSKWLSSAEYGDYDLYVTYISLLIPVSTFSCGEAIFRFLIERDNIQSKKEIISSAIGIAFLGYIISIVILLLFARSLFTSCFIEFLILFALETIFSLSQYCARGLHQIKYYTASSILCSIFIALFATLFICGFSMGLRGLLIGQACGFLIGIIFCWYKLKIYHYLRFTEFSKKTAKEIVKYSAPLIPNSIAWWIADGSDRTVIKINLGSEYNGIYSLANKIPALCITVFNMFHMSWQESASDAIKDDKDAGEYFNGVFHGLIPMLLSVAIGVLSLNFFLYEYIFDSKYASGYVHVSILTTATIFSFFSQFIGGIFIALKKTSVNGITTCLAAIVNIVIDLLLIQYVGLFAASISTLVSYGFLFVVRFCIIQKSFLITFNKKAFVYFALFVYFVIVQYINNNFLNYFNLVLAIVIFILTNKDMIKKMIARFKGFLHIS